MPGYAPSGYEYSVTVPKMFTEPSSEPEIVIAISVRGGGTVGKSYEQNHWDYAVYADGSEVTNGDELRSGAPKTHAEMARELAGYLSATLAGRNLDADAIALLVRESDRFALFADEEEDNWSWSTASALYQIEHGDPSKDDKTASAAQYLRDLLQSDDIVTVRNVGVELLERLAG